MWRGGNFYPRPPRGGRLADVAEQRVDFLISIHALREEGDPNSAAVRKQVFHISIHALREEGDRRDRHGRHGIMISIHALREEGDTTRVRRGRTSHNFYPRPPRGGRPKVSALPENEALFLSTPSARRATPHHRGQRPREAISIHALREEGDCPLCIPASLPCDFYPRPPRGGRPACAALHADAEIISIHALREEGDLLHYPRSPSGPPISIHALREEGDVLGGASTLINADFYPRPPRGGRHFFRENFSRV